MTNEVQTEAPVVGASVRSKVCRDCWIDKTLDSFYAHTKNPDGSIRLWQAYCKECQRERTRFYARQRRRRLGIPERNGGPYRIKNGHHESGYRDLVPSGPFSEWLKKHIAQLDADLAYMHDKHDRSGVTKVAEAAGVDVERIRRLKDGRLDNVTLGFVDRVLVSSGTETMLWELYDEY